MKIKRLRILNLASIEDETIDFTQQPLAGSDVFLITGKTGSGKTTLLDAICLALYRTTPRLAGARKERVANNRDELSLNDPRQLMRRNTGEAMVRLDFAGTDGHEYQAEWHVQRGKKKNPGASLDPSTWRLTDLTTGRELTARGDKDTEVRQAIREAVGLEFNQFCRTTMLAQGEFTRFLKSDESGKAEILEKITRLGRYRAIGSRIYALTDEKRRANDAAQERAQDKGLTPEALAELVTRIDSLRQQTADVAQRRETAGRKLQWLVSHQQLSQEQQRNAAELARAQAAADSPELQARRQLTEEWQQTIDVRSARREGLLAQQEAQRQQQALSQSTPRLDALRHDIAQREEQQARVALSDLRDERTALDRRRHQLSMASRSLKALAEARQHRQQQEKDLSDQLAQISRDQAQLQANVAPLAEAKGRMEAAGEAVERLKNTVDKWAKDIRSELREGDTCPVCGHRIVAGELPEEAVLDQLYVEAKASHEQARQAHEALQRQQQTLTARIEATQASSDRLRSALKADQSVPRAEQQAAADCQLCGITQPTDIPAQDEAARLRIEALTQQIATGEKEEKALAQLHREADGLTAAVNTARSLLEAAQQKATACDEQVAQYLSQHPQLDTARLDALSQLTLATITQHRRHIEQVTSDLERQLALKANIAQRIASHEAGRPALDEQDTPEALRAATSEADAHLATLNQQLGSALQAQADDQAKKARLGPLEEEARQAAATYERWHRLCQQLGDKEGEKFLRIAQSYILADLLNGANAYLARLAPRYTLRAVPGTLHISLEDAYQGFATRSTLTLSGGESFLVSLALALALADIGQQLAVDTLFIDEGFGTLSGQALTAAINTLRQLHSRSGRHVGIISHIDEVKDSIPVQIRVEQEGGASRVVVTG